MNGIEILETLSAGKRVIGTLLTNASPYWPAKVAELDLDFVFIDTEHIAFDRTQVSNLCQALPPETSSPLCESKSRSYQASMVSDDEPVAS